VTFPIPILALSIFAHNTQWVEDQYPSWQAISFWLGHSLKTPYDIALIFLTIVLAITLINFFHTSESFLGRNSWFGCRFLKSITNNFSLDTWNIGCNLLSLSNFSLYTSKYTTSSILHGLFYLPITLGEMYLGSKMSIVSRHTICPFKYITSQVAILNLLTLRETYHIFLYIMHIGSSIILFK
jgi:hypothetical protein